jgi:hypothetical protein
MSDYVAQLTNPRYPRERSDAERLIAAFETEASVADGVVRWNSNERVPPQDILDLWLHCEKPFDPVRTKQAREQEVAALLAQYRADRAGRSPSSEERAAARAAHGAGVALVNVITGTTFTT